MKKAISTFISTYRPQIIFYLIFLLGVGAFSLLILLDNRIPNTDDTVFPVQILPFSNVIEWITYRYESWSGRIFSEGFVYIFSPAPLLFWKIVTIAAFIVFTLCAFGFYRLLSGKKSPVTDRVALILALSLPFLLNVSVFADSILWVTGSMVYFWVTTLGLVALYPLIYYSVRRKLPHLAVSILGGLAAVIAASSQEQVGAVLLGITLALLGYNIWVLRGEKKKPIPLFILTFLLIVGLSFAISALAPGNDARLESEISTWQPEFNEVSLLDRAEYGFRWILEALINHSGFILVAVWISLTVLLAVKKKRKLLDYVFMFLFITASLFLLSRGNAAIAYWLEFYATWNPEIPSKLFLMHLVVWPVILLATAAAPVIIFKKKPIGFLLTLLILAAYASTAIMVLSPTLYVSQWRSFFVPSIVLLFVTYLLINIVLAKFPKYRALTVCVILTLGLSHLIYQTVRLLAIF